jgi:hypothetical protein
LTSNAAWTGACELCTLAANGYPLYGRFGYSTETDATSAPMAPMTAYRTPRPASDWATSATSSADWPGAQARIRRYCVSRRVLAGNLGVRKLRHKPAMRQKLGQPLLCGHTLGSLREDCGAQPRPVEIP